MLILPSLIVPPLSMCCCNEVGPICQVCTGSYYSFAAVQSAGWADTATCSGCDPSLNSTFLLPQIPSQPCAFFSSFTQPWCPGIGSPTFSVSAGVQKLVNQDGFAVEVKFSNVGFITHIFVSNKFTDQNIFDCAILADVAFRCWRVQGQPTHCVPPAFVDVEFLR